MLLPISICGRKMSVFRYFIPENAILQQIDASIERLLADFRWQSIDFVDALTREKGLYPAAPSGRLRNTVLGSNRRKRNVFKAHGVISVTPFALPSVHGSG